MRNAMTIDVEDYFMVSAFSNVVRFSDWPSYECRVEENTKRILDLLSKNDTKATFFVLGWIAERHPGIVREIHASGHEVACHSYNHRLVYDLTPEEFRQDTRKAKGILEDLTGGPVIGFRAASYSLVKENLWALDILIEEGFKYDSSIFPIYHDRYGIPGARRFAYNIKRGGGAICEYPPSTFRVFGHNIPVAGGGYLRLFPSWFTSMAVKRINNVENEPAVFYIHPWEIDKDQPRIKSRLLTGFRHHVNIGTTMPKLRAFLKEFKFQPLYRFLDEKRPDATVEL